MLRLPEQSRASDGLLRLRLYQCVTAETEASAAMPSNDAEHTEIRPLNEKARLVAGLVMKSLDETVVKMESAAQRELPRLAAAAAVNVHIISITRLLYAPARGLRSTRLSNSDLRATVLLDPGPFSP